MNVIEIPQLGKKVEYPSSWEECDAEQLQYIFRQAGKLISGGTDLLEFRISVFYHLAGIGRKQKHNRKESFMSEEQLLQKFDNIVRAATTVDFVFQERDGQLLFEFDCVRNLIPEIQIQEQVFYGPSDVLFNISFGEYRVAYDYYGRFVRTQDEDALNGLCAVLYRPARSGEWDDDIREVFNPHVCAKRKELFNEVPYELRSVILAWFSACDNYFKTGELEVDGRLISLAPLFKKSGNEIDGVPVEDAGELGLTGILMSIADNGTFGPASEVEKTNLYTVLLKLYHWHLEHKRQEKIYSKYGKSE